MYEPVSYEDVGRVIEALATAIPKFAPKPEKMANVVGIYRSGLTDFDRETLSGALGMLIRERDTFPTLKMVRETCREWLKHNRIRVEWTGALDRDGNDIACRVCRSVGRWAVLSRADDSTFVRRIAPCDAERHGQGDMIVPMPSNFVRWSVEL